MQAQPSLDLFVLNPLFGLGLTLGVYVLATALHNASGQPAVLHPVLTSVAGVVAVLVVVDLGYDVYFAQAEPLHNALSVFVVLLAVPLVKRLSMIRKTKWPVIGALMIGSVTAVGTALIVPVWKGADPSILASIAPKSATAAVALGISDRIGGVVGLTAMASVITGLFGAMFGPAVLNAFGVRDQRAVGFAIGVAAHAIGTARAFQISPQAGTFASLGMILNAVLTVALAPMVLGLLR